MFLKITNINRGLFLGIAAISLIGASSLTITTNASAETTPEQFAERIVKAEPLPEDAHLVVGYPEQDEDELLVQLLGEENYNALMDFFIRMNNEYNDDNFDSEEEYMNTTYPIMFEFYDQLGILDIRGDYYDFHLENDQGDPVLYTGDGITIQYDFGLDLDSDVDGGTIRDILDTYSSKKWEYKIAHLTDDGGVEFLPATVSDGIWEFVAKDFSVYIPVLTAVEESAPQTLDSSIAYIGIIAISLLTITGYSVYLRRIRR